MIIDDVVEGADRFDAKRYASQCVAIDLEVGKADSKIHQIGAVRLEPSNFQPVEFAYKQGDSVYGVNRLDVFCANQPLVVGHNYVGFDRLFLAATKDDLSILCRPMLDTLWLNPLAFPRNPYHHLIKHYHDGRLSSGEVNDPVKDAAITLDVLIDQFCALRSVNHINPKLIEAWHWLTARGPSGDGFDSFFQAIRVNQIPSHQQAKKSIEACLSGSTCQTTGGLVVEEAAEYGWSLAYTLAWLSVAGDNSVVPPWVQNQFPKVGELVRRLRDTSCGQPECKWCSERHDATQELRRWFPDLNEFRAIPVDSEGNPLQRSIVQSAMRGEHVLGILPTGTGKSVCYQVPALSRFDKTGALTVVISPLVALMEDQVNGLLTRGIASAAAINGLLSMPERAAVLERLRLGDIGILIVSPEQLRNKTLRNALSQREIGSWVLDEAHCISKWGHDFRPDYRYVGRFIKERARDGQIPPILCLTATAKPDVVRDIVEHFETKVGVRLRVFDGGASRSNLEFSVLETTPIEKLGHVYQLLCQALPSDRQGGAIVYCATRKKTEEVAGFLQAKGLTAGYFHANLAPQVKKDVQSRFIAGDLKVIAATNAFGMGIDKPDVRLVIHADIPGSLENYLQEAGRAGRDREQAECVLLYTSDDVERQFGMSARSRLNQREIQAVLQALRNLDRKRKRSGEIVATSGEILTEDERSDFEKDSATDDTRVRTAIAWLEESSLLKRDENLVMVFPSSLKIRSLEDARKKLAKSQLFDIYRNQLLQIVQAMMDAEKDDGISTDSLMGLTGLTSEQIRKAMHDLESFGISSNDMALTAFVHVGVSDSSVARFGKADELESGVIDALRIAAPDMSRGETQRLKIRHLNQQVKDNGHPSVRPDQIRRILRSLAEDGRTDDGGVGSLRLRARDSEDVDVTLIRDWSTLSSIAQRRRAAARHLLNHFLSKLPQGERGKDLLAESTLGELKLAMLSDLVIKSSTKNPDGLMDRGLLWLHEQEVLRLNKGLAVFRPAMTIQLEEGRRRFTKADFMPLEIHYEEQVIQIHVMNEYVQRGLKAMPDAIHLSQDYFHLDQSEFLRRWMPNREKELRQQTTPDSWRKIVEVLRNPIQQEIVADDREQTNVLILAGPGSGKTRVLVHRIAYLIRVRREKPEGILALAYNRHAAVEISKRLRDLIGDDARGVLVMTCHALAMRLVGASFLNRADALQGDPFKQVLVDAVKLLRGDDLPPEEADEQRDRLLAGFRRILVDEYQDIGPEQYELISALAGRNRKDEEGKNTLFAVGDDDQNIYAFNGASVSFIRMFEKDYDAKPYYLIENYRSSAHIIGAANSVIAQGRYRMKSAHPIKIDNARGKEPLGGDWLTIDPVCQGRVQLLTVSSEDSPAFVAQGAAIMQEFMRLKGLTSSWSWDQCAVIAREWKFLDSVRSWCELHSIPVQIANEDSVVVWRLRETQALVQWVYSQKQDLLNLADMRAWINAKPLNPWWELLLEAVDSYCLEVASLDHPPTHFLDWLAEWGREVRRRQTGVLLLTAHRAKGLEFDHVAILDGAWDKSNSDSDESRRLFYVAMTRARLTLVIAQVGVSHCFEESLTASGHVARHECTSLAVAPELVRKYISPSLRDIDIGYAGRYAASNSVHIRISGLRFGDSLRLVRDSQSWLLVDTTGHPVGKMSKIFEPPLGKECIDARVRAVLSRTINIVPDGQFKQLIKVPEWEVVVPELVFE